MDKEKAYNYANGYRTKLVVDSAVDEWREQHQAEAQAEYENMGVLDRINDTISRNIDTEAIGNTVQQFGNTLWETGGDIVDSARQWNENHLKFLHESANLQEKALNGQVTEEDINNLRQSGREASVSLTNIAASPFRQAARNFIKNNAADNNSFFQGAAQSLQQSDVNLEYFMTPVEKLQKSREIEQDLGIPAGSTLANNDAYREALEMYNFKQKSDNIEEVWEKYPELQRIADMDPEGAAVALHDMQTVKNTRDVVDTFKTFLEKGNTELEYNNLQYKIMMGRATDEEIKRAEDLKARVEVGNKLEAPGFFQSPLASMAAGVAGSLPEMGQSLVEGAEGGGAAGAALTVGAVALTIATGGTDLLAAGGVAAMRAAIMRALASEAGRKLIKTGLYSGLIHGMGAPESGRNYGEMKDMKKPDGTQLYTDEEARNWSLLRGYTNAAIEVANFGMAAKAVYPVANRVFAQSVEQITRETLGRETLKDFARGRVGDWLKLTASESAEEAAQSAADDVISNVALYTKGEDAAQYKQYSIMDIATRAGQAFIESLPASMGFATIGAGVGTITGAGRMARARKRAADMERDYGKKNTQTMMGVMAVEQLQKAVEQGNLDKVAPDVQKKVLKEQLAGTEFSRAYIDVEMAMQKENGREDLQKIAEAEGMSADELEAAITVNGYIPVGTETLAQAKVSPDLLDSVSFSEDADSMARMRENGKTIIEDYKKNFDKMVKRQEKLADAIIENNMKNATAEQKAILRQVMLSNISNPAQAWNDLRKIYNDELQEKIGPALEALKRGMGNAGLMETQDEQGNTKTVRYTENDEWYRNFYKTFKRKPTTAELEEMAIAMVTGDSNAPKVAGWIPDSAETQAEFEKNRSVIEQLKNNIALLDSVKEEAKKLTGVEMELTQGLTPEAFKVYRAISSWTNKAGGKIARAGRISAILVARHADLYAEAIRKNTGKKYTAEDYIRERLGFQLVQDSIDRDGVLKQSSNLGDILLQRAWHGTPHDFEKFDLGAIGTGEGAQAHGWGLYFAGNREVSKNYQDVLSGNYQTIIIGRTKYKPDDNYNLISKKGKKVRDLGEEYVIAGKCLLIEKDIDKSVKILNAIDEEGEMLYGEWITKEDGIKAAELIQKGKVKTEKGGKLFEVEIPDNDVLLDEQKPFNEQPEKVQNALRKLISESETAKKHPAFAEQIYEAKGKTIYSIVVGLAEGDAPKNANFDNTRKFGSELLNKYGIKGITYEGDGDGRCFVVFDDKAVEVIEKYNQRAWHGTPHDFEKFDLGAIGTGEGQQVHGWGLYFAQDRSISENRYKKRLSKGRKKEKIYKINGKEVIIDEDENYNNYDNKTYADNPQANAEKYAAWLIDQGKTKKEILEDIEDEKQQTNDYYEDNGEEWSERELKFLNELEKIIKERKIEFVKLKEKQGKLFGVEIPDNDVLLDEQKPLSQQPEKVKEAIINILAEETAIETTANTEQLINDEIETLEYVQKKIIESKDLSKTALELIEDPIYEYGTVSEESVKIFDLLREGKKSQGLLLAKQLIAKLTNEKNKLLDRNADKQEEIKKVVEKKYRNTRGEKLYEMIAYSPREASEKLNAAGVKGITYEGGTDGRCFVIFDDKAIDIIEKYNQQFNSAQEEVNGWIDEDKEHPGRRIISIMETADESTFMHEMAHAFLFDLEDLAKIDDTSAKELEIVNQWAEWKKGDYKEYKRTAWAKDFAKLEQEIIDAEEHHDIITAKAKKAQWRQERFARGFEMYLKEGNAPAPGLKAVFRLFKQFLSAIYKAFTGDGGKPSVQVRRVMDRMIASEDEIEAAALQDRYTDVVKAGGEKLFNEREEDTMKRWLKEEQENAKEKVLKLVMKDLEKEKELAYNNQMRAERERYQKELSQENIFLARNLIAETKDKKSAEMWFDSVEKFEALDKVTPDMEKLVNQHMQEYGEQLDKSLIDSHLSQENIDKAMDSSKYRAKMEKYILKGMERKKNLVNQINAKARAAMTSIEEKLNALPEDVDLQLEKRDNPTIKDIIKEITKLRFAGKWNTQDINHIEAMLRASTQEEARKALKEFKEQQKQKKQNMQDIEEATKGMEKMYRDLIKQTTADRPMSETCNIKYYKDKERNTDRRVKQMAKIQNWEMAIHQQRQKVFYSMMVKQARKNRDTRDKMIKDLQRKLNAKTVKIPKDERYWFNRILYIMRLNPTNPKLPEGGVTSLDNIFKEQQESLENIYVPDQLIRIRDEGENFGDYNKMTLNDFRETYEDLIRLYELGRTKFNFKSIAGKSFEDVAQELMSDPSKMPGMMALTRKVGPNQGGIGYIDTLGNFGQTGDDIAKNIQKYHNSILKPENILEMLGKKAQKYIYGLLEKAAEQEAELAEKNLRALQEINAMYTREEHQSWTEQKYDFPGTKGWKITKENILMMAINYGSEKNRQRLIGGLIEDGRKKNNMSAEQVRQAIEDLFTQTMTAKDWQYIQKLWDHIGSYWHDTAAVEEKLNGIALGKVEPMPFSIQTADGQVANLKGGYMHIKYDFEKSSRAEENEINDMAMSISAGARRLGVGRGMTKARTEHNVYMEVDLHFDVIEQHLQDVIHNIAYRIPIRDIYRLLHYKNYSTGVNLEDYIKESLGVEAFRVLDAWAMDAWRQVSDNRNSAEGSLNKFARYLRTNATMAIMGFRIKPVLENIGNLPIAMNQIGSIKMLNALFGFYWNRGENYKEVIARSAFMRTRAENLDRDLKNQPGVFRAGNKLLEVARQHAYDMLVITDLMVSAPMWWQVYHESIKPKMKEVQKENEENMQKRIDLANKADSIRAEIAGHFQGAADIDEHLKTRRYGTPAEIEALRSSEFAGISEGELRAQWGQHQNEIRNLRKELFKVEQEQEKANQLPVWSDDEIIEEAKQRAVFAADKVVRDTIGSGRVIDQSAVQRSTNEFVRLFTAFYAFFNAQWNLIYMAYAKSRYAPEGTGSIEKWAPLAKTLMFNVFLSALITTAVGFTFGLKGDSDDEKFETITNAEGKKEKVEKPWLERFLRAYAKESLSVSTGGLYGIRDIVQLMGDYAFSGQNFGYKMGSVATRGISETLRAGAMLIRKGEKDAEIQAREDKRLKTHEEKLKKLKGKKRREYLQKWEEEQKYRKPPKRITYEEILSHGVTGLTTLTAARTGLTTTLTDAITHTMMYMMDKDMRYDASWKNIVWSAIFDKKPVEREIPKKPPKEETKKNKKKRKQSER